MSNRRRHKGEIHHQEVHGTTRSNRRNPPHGTWQPTVPSWEKRFCYSVGLVPWTKLLETKKSMYLFQNVVQWNDSAGEEAFLNAKTRFWAKINGLPCDISLPDPDIYIDEIDWNSNIDPELYTDLEREPKYPEKKEKGEEVVIFGSSVHMYSSVWGTGWGEAEEGLQNADPAVLDPGYKDCNQKVNNGNPCESNVAQAGGAVIDNEWGNCWNDSYGCKNNYNEWNNYNDWDNNYNQWKNSGDTTGGNLGRWNEWDNNYNQWKNSGDTTGGNLGRWNEWDNNYNQWKNSGDTTGGNLGRWNETIRKKDGAGWPMSRYKTSRFGRNDCQMDGGWWRNGRGRKKMNFVY